MHACKGTCSAQATKDSRLNPMLTWGALSPPPTHTLTDINYKLNKFSIPFPSFSHVQIRQGAAAPDGTVSGVNKHFSIEILKAHCKKCPALLKATESYKFIDKMLTLYLDVNDLISMLRSEALKVKRY